MKLRALILLVVISFWGCYRSDLKKDGALNRSSWDGYVCVHNFSLDEQAIYLESLINVGALRGVRMDRLEDNNELVYWLHARGVDVLGIFDNEHLRDPNVVEIFHRYVQEYPFIDNWEIGNEVDYFIKPSMTAKEYMNIFDKIYQASRGWGITIVSQAPFGTIAGSRQGSITGLRISPRTATIPSRLAAGSSRALPRPTWHTWPAYCAPATWPPPSTELATWIPA